MMARLAFIFHWQLDRMETMPLPELIDWHDRAIEIWNEVNKERE